MSLSAAQIAELAASLCEYVRAHFDVGRPDELWGVGVYSGKDDQLTKPFTENSAPDIVDLLRCQKLWELLLSIMPSARIRDRDVAIAVKQMVAAEPRANTTGLPMAMFVTWWLKACHLSLSHIRDFPRFQIRFEYRIGKLEDDDRDRILSA